MNQNLSVQKNIFDFLTRALGLFLLTVFATGCASSAPAPSPVDPGRRETAIFECKKEFQAKKKARFEELPLLIRRLLGDHRVLGEFPKRPGLADMRRIISRFPLEGDSGGLWRTEENAHLRTVSGSVRKNNGTEIVTLVFGQPGRTMTFPLTSMNRTKTGLLGVLKTSDMHLRPVDDHHVFVEAKVAGTQRIYALIRTYATQSFAEESKTILTDYPIFSDELNDDVCEDIVI